MTDGDLARGHVPALRPSSRCRADSWIWTTELFVPLIAVAAVDSLDEAFTLANDTPLGLTAGMFSTDAGRGRRVPRPHRGRRRLHQPAGGRDHRRVAGRAAVRRLEGLGHERQGGRRPVLRAAVPSRAEPNGGGCMTTVDGTDLATATAPALVTDLPGPRPRRGSSATSGSPARRWAASTRSCRSAAAGLVIEDVDGNRFLDFNAGIAVTSTGHCHPDGRRRDLDPGRPAHPLLLERLLPAGVRGAVGAARRAGARSPGASKVFLTNSGTEAVEASIKLARHATGRQYVDRVPRRVPRPQPRQPVAHREQGEVPARASARCCPACTTRRTASTATSRTCCSSTSSRPRRSRRSSSSRSRARAATSSRPPGGSRGSRSCASGTASCSSPTRSRAGSAAPGKLWAVEHEGIEPDVLLSGKGIASGMPLGALDRARRTS